MGLFNSGFLLFLLSLVLLFGFVYPENNPRSGASKLSLEDETINDLTASYVDGFGDDLTFLRISHSRINHIDPFAFDSLKHLNLLELSDSEIEEMIDPVTFKRLPGLEMLVLRNVSLQELHLLLENVQELIVSGNKISEIGGKRVVGENINYLDVSNNRLEVLEESLATLEKLSVIDISRNRIRYIGDNVFQNNTNLLRILATDNRIATTDGLRLPWVKTLYLHANRLESLDSGSFSGMKSLEELLLSFNHIKSIKNAFDDLLELKYLNLDWNALENLSPDVFKNNLYLNKVSLQGNNLKSLDRFVNVLHHLDHLDLSCNRISQIDDEFFSSTPNLRVLDLSNNKLKTVGDLFAPLASLKVLDLAYNDISLRGFELSANYKLTHLNLSNNWLETGLSNFVNNTMLVSLDLSHNYISDFCDTVHVPITLRKLSLSSNRIKELPQKCLWAGNSLCQVDVRNNPLICNKDLDALVLKMALARTSPFGAARVPLSDVPSSQCDTLSLNESISLWNSIKHDLCPNGFDLQPKVANRTSEWESSEESESSEEKTPDETSHKKKQILVAPLGHIRKEDFAKHVPQSERLSWERIDSDPGLTEGFEEEELAARKPHISWYTVALILIGISFTLTCFNLLVFAYIRVKLQKKSDKNSPQKYTILHNEVYKNTTEPSPVEVDWAVGNQTRNKIFSFGKINEFLLDFSMSKKDKDSESAKNVLIGPSNSSHC